MADNFVTWSIEDILVGEDLPGPVYLYIDFRFITLRGAGDTIDRSTYDRLLFKKVKNLFVKEEDRKKFDDWILQVVEDRALQASPQTPQGKKIAKLRDHLSRKLYDIFLNNNPNRVVSQTIQASREMVDEVMAFPYTTQSLSELQSFSQGTVDHSVNVSILSVYLAMQMGYSHAVVLQHLAVGCLLHDVGKIHVPVSDSDSDEVYAQKMMAHPTVGAEFLAKDTKVPAEVKMIVEQHHERYDGSGFPKKLRGSQIYDLARIVAIANTFDELVAGGKGSLKERQTLALNDLDHNYYKQFDPQKLEKCLKILKLGL